jgi:8-oxo-dGTP pyrophosphatase MutT (NUDIX family)
LASTCLESVEAFPDWIRKCLADGSGNDPSLLNSGYRRAAVLMPLLLLNAEWHVMFTRRSNTVQDHKGQVSFPGGVAEEFDESPERTACRELEEEIGIPQKEVEILGQMGEMPTITSYLVTPVVGVIPWSTELTPNPTEVDRVFTIPLCWLADPSHHEERLYRLSDGSEHPVIFFEEFDGELLWGVTARIVLNFLDKVGLPKK